MLNKVFVPPIKTQGIKTKLVPLIDECCSLEPSSVWVEPFMGSGVVGFNLARENAIFADTNPHIINFYNSLKRSQITPQEVREFLEEEGENLLKEDAAYYYRVRERFNNYHNPLDFLFLNRACFNGMIRFNKSFDFNVPYGHKRQRFSKSYITKIVNQVAFVKRRIDQNNWMFKCQSFEQTLTGLSENCFIYCDPPYIGRNVDYYDSWDICKEQQLCSLLKKMPVRFILSTWDHNSFRKNEYINSLWGFCQKITQEHFYHIGGLEKNRNPMTEALLVNYKIKVKKEVNRNNQLILFDS